ncbi:hypothetical protein RZO07_10375 [Pseudomonas protegens]|uniref:hypothetical protein n=1 Tax=Pseudomonas protegens TaxID=380021 RepID=UPI0029373428|nr:hypothetical protein [Pseudomonas protegens]WOE81608.1 hypothetical protein RZO07_10375 [Pseudomonas protegens]
MSTEYKPTLRFNALETRRINSAASKAKMKPAEWMRKLILDQAPQLDIADPLVVRVAGFKEPFGWNLIHYAEALAHAETFLADVSDIADYMERYTTIEEGEVWIDCDKLPGVSYGNVASVEAKAVYLCRGINLAHIHVLIANEGSGL